MNTVYVAVYETEEGPQVEVFSSYAGAMNYRYEIAKNNWEHYLDEPMPEDPHELADRYFEYHGDQIFHGQYFSVHDCVVQGCVA